MDSGSIPRIIVMVILVILSGCFSATETAFSSMNRTRVRSLAEKGLRRAATVLNVSENYDRLLSTILICNNIVNIALASIGTVFFVSICGSGGATVSTIVVTVAVLIFGEITPKSLAKDSPERFCMFAAPVMRALIVIMTPLNFVFNKWTLMLSRLVKTDGNRSMTEDELRMMVSEAGQGGGIEEDEVSLLQSAVDFNDKEAEEILTHRVDLSAVPLDASPEEVADMFTRTNFSRILVYEGNIDNIVGVLHIKDFYTGMGVTDRSIGEIMTKPVFVPQSVKIDELLRLMQRSKVQVAVVSDEYGGTMGIVTIEDILEELVGEIWDEHDEVVEMFRWVQDDVCVVNCSADLDDMFRELGIKCSSDSATISGWVTEQMGRIPDAGESFTFGDMEITVTKTDSRRILEIRVRITAPEKRERTS